MANYEAEPEDQKDTLMMLRDRLLESRAGTLKGLKKEETLKKETTNSNADTQASLQQSTDPNFSPGIKQLHQIDQMIVQSSQTFVQNQLPMQALNPLLVNGGLQKVYVQAQSYYSPQANTIVPIILPTNPTSTIGNLTLPPTYNSIPLGPSQTVNINQPQAKEMNVQNFTISNSHPIQVQNPAYQIDSFTSQQLLQQQQQLQFYQLHQQQQQQQNLINQQTNGVQVLYQPVYAVSQNSGNNLTSLFPQAAASQPVYVDKYNIGYNINQLQTQAPAYAWGNQLQNVVNDLKHKLSGSQTIPQLVMNSLKGRGNEKMLTTNLTTLGI